MTWMSVVGMAKWESNPGDALPGSLLMDQAFQQSDSIQWVLDGVSDLLLLLYPAYWDLPHLAGNWKRGYPGLFST